MPRYFFVLPDVHKPTGGIAVAIQMANILRAEGYDANLVNGQESYNYTFSDEAMEHYYYPPLGRVAEQFMRRRDKVKITASHLVTLPKKRTNPLLTIRPDDVFVVPEFWYPEYCALFPDNKHILLSQHVLSFCTATLRDGLNGRRFLDEFEAVITISEATKTSVEVFARRDSYLVSQSIARPGLDSTRVKERKICFMPRKRARDVEIIEGYLKNAPYFDGWELCRIQNMTNHELEETLSESLIFLSFSHEEGFGLPPAEAMAAGCIVIGYTGVGGDEFFDATSGIPIEDADITAFAQSIERVIQEYDVDPTRLDNIRKSAAQRISSTYTQDAMRTSLLAAWGEIEKRIT